MGGYAPTKKKDNHHKWKHVPLECHCKYNIIVEHANKNLNIILFFMCWNGFEILFQHVKMNWSNAIRKKVVCGHQGIVSKQRSRPYSHQASIDINLGHHALALLLWNTKTTFLTSD